VIQQDDPRATQPLTYQKIQNHPTTLQIYSEKLVGEGIITHDVKNLFPQPFFSMLLILFWISNNLVLSLNFLRFLARRAFYNLGIIYLSGH
jgi:hypothetical protein